MQAATYEVGPGKALAAIGKVPWQRLQPGDTVLIHWRPEPYREKFTVWHQGTAKAPIRVRGVPGPGGQLPVIDGENAVTPPSPSYQSEGRSVVHVRATDMSAAAAPPRYIVIESLEIRGGREPNTFTAADGSIRKYARNACALYVRGEHITVRRCTLDDSGNGLFVSTPDLTPSHDILVDSNYIYGNGVVGSVYDHNSYTAARSITFQYNHYGPLRPGAGGNNLKDRSAGLVVRYNWIEGGSRELDLVDAEDSSALRADPAYRRTVVYGNILIEPPGDGNNQILHYGGDSRKEDWYRKGTLYFFNNTIVSRRTDRTTLFRLSTNDERCEARNNIFYTVKAGATLSLVNTAGHLVLSHNWIKPGWRPAFSELTGRIDNDHTMIETDAPGFVDEAGEDYRPAAKSPAARQGAAVPEKVDRQYTKHQRWEKRADARDIGAYRRAK